MYKHKIEFKKREVEGYKKMIDESTIKMNAYYKSGDIDKAITEKQRIEYFENQIFDLERDIARMEAGIPPKHN